MTKAVKNTAIAALTLVTVAFGANSAAQATTGDISYYGVPQFSLSKSSSAIQLPVLRSRAFNTASVNDQNKVGAGDISYYGVPERSAK